MQERSLSDIGIGRNLSADRPEKHSGEAAMTAATYNQEVGAPEASTST